MPPDSPRPRRPLLGRLGPGLITACVIIGPGSILTSSRVGATHGFELLWVLVIAVVFMMTYMTLGARLGVLAEGTPAELLEKFPGRWLAMLIGLSIFGISAAYQFGNNLGVYAALTELTRDPGEAAPKTLGLAALVVVNGLAIAFLFAFRDLYRWLERVMTVFVALMLLAFFVNLLLAPPAPLDMLRGLVPRLPRSSDGTSPDWVPVLGWIGTTFITGVAYNQAYLVRQKGWTRKDLADGLLDARVGTLISAVITLMLLSTAATALRGREIATISDVASQLDALFGTTGEILFCLGLFCASYSSYLVNSLIGGFLLADGLRLGVGREDPWPRRFATVILLVGLGIGATAIVLEVPPVPAVIFAQALTVVAAPLVGGVLWALTSSRRHLTGDQRNGPVTHFLAGSGFLLLLVLSGYLVIVKIIPALAGD